MGWHQAPAPEAAGGGKEKAVNSWVRNASRCHGELPPSAAGGLPLPPPPSQDQGQAPGHLLPGQAEGRQKWKGEVRD